MENRFVYADNAATTRVSEPVLAAMLPYLKEQYGNASSIYSLGRRAKQAVEVAREQVAAALGAEPAEIYFTSGGTEADNWALFGVLRKLAAQGKRHLITTSIEHHAVLHPCQALEKEGFEVSYLPVSTEGLVDPADLSAAMREDTALVSIIYANNEIGTVQPIAEFGALCRERGLLFHTDAVQAVGNLPIDVKVQQIDLLSLSGHKLHAPKGVGALYVKRGLRLPNLLFGGAQERKLRPGTENVAGIVALGTAIELATSDIPGKIAQVTALRERLLAGLAELPALQLNGHRTQRLAGNINLSVGGVEGEGLLLQLDQAGIAASSGSACTSGALDPSHVLLALGLSHAQAHGALRLSLNEETSEQDVDYIVAALLRIIPRLRAMSPFWQEPGPPVS